MKNAVLVFLTILPASALAGVPSMKCESRDGTILLSDEFLISNPNDKLVSDPQLRGIEAFRTPNMLWELLDLGGDQKAKDISFQAVETSSHGRDPIATLKAIRVSEISGEVFDVSAEITIPYQYADRAVSLKCEAIE